MALRSLAFIFTFVAVAAPSVARPVHLADNVDALQQQHSSKVAGRDIVVYERDIFVETVLDGNRANLSVFGTAAVPMKDFVFAVDSTGSQLLKMPLSFIDDGGRITEAGGAERLVGDGSGRRGYQDGWGEDALLDRPKGIAVDEFLNVYVADVRNRVIRKVTPDGYVSTLAGQSQITGKTDGDGRSASFSANFDITYLPTICSLLISDRGNRRLRMIKLPRDCDTKKTSSGWFHVDIQSVLFSVTVTVLLAAVTKLQRQISELQSFVAISPLQNGGERSTVDVQAADGQGRTIGDPPAIGQREGAADIGSDLIHFSDISDASEGNESGRQNGRPQTSVAAAGPLYRSIESEGSGNDDGGDDPAQERLEGLGSDSESSMTDTSDSSSGCSASDGRIPIEEMMLSNLKEFGESKR